MKQKTMLGAVEAGGTKIVCAVGNLNAKELQIYAREEFKTTSNPDKTITSVLKWFQLKQKQFNKRLISMGISSFGPLCLDKALPNYGSILSTPKDGWSNFNILSQFKNEFPNISISIDTDVNGSALGEYYYGAAKSINDFIYITIGTGIGAGAMVNGQLVHGIAHPEMGHMKIPRINGDKFQGSCTFHQDCWEGLCSGTAVLARTCKNAEDLLRSDPAWNIEIEYIATAIANLFFLFSPQRIIIGGGISKGGQLGASDFFKRTREHFLQKICGYANAAKLTKENVDNYIVSPALGDNSGIYGSFILASERRPTDYMKHEDSRKRIEKEDDLINHRMSWCVGSNSFLLAALMVATNNQNPTSFSVIVKGFIPYAGLSLSICFIISILAAYFAIWNWRNYCEDYGKKYVFSPIHIALSGSVASILSPVIFISIWTVLIRSGQTLPYEVSPGTTKEIEAFTEIIKAVSISSSIVFFGFLLWVSLIFYKEYQHLHTKSHNIVHTTILTKHRIFLTSELLLYIIYTLSLLRDNKPLNYLATFASITGAVYSILYNPHDYAAETNSSSAQPHTHPYIHRLETIIPIAMATLWALFYFYAFYLLR